MKYHGGDTVLVQGRIHIANLRDNAYCVEFNNGKIAWYQEEEIFELPKPDKAYEQGLKDAWKLAMRICGTDDKILQKTFASKSEVYIFANNTPQEALAKLKAYEDSHSIKVGDVVEFADGTKAIVMDTDTDDSLALFTENACVEAWTKPENVKKTGKHINIESLLEQIKGDSNE